MKPCPNCLPRRLRRKTDGPRLPARNGSAKLSLSARLEAVLAERARIQRDMGMKEQQLEADARLNRELGEKREILQRQEAIPPLARILHDLIGFP